MKLLRVPFVLSLLASAALIPSLAPAVRAADAAGGAAAQAECPVTHEKFTDSAAHQGVVVDGKRVAFCCGACPTAFKSEPEKYVTDAMLGSCPVMTGHNKKSAEHRVVINNQIQYFCCGGCDTKFSAEPSKYVASLTDVVSKKSFKPSATSPRTDYKGQVYLFADADNKASFDKEPGKYAVIYGPKKAVTTTASAK